MLALLVRAVHVMMSPKSRVACRTSGVKAGALRTPSTNSSTISSREVERVAAGFRVSIHQIGSRITAFLEHQGRAVRRESDHFDGR